MKKYLAPLGVFAGGMITALLLYLFLGNIGDAADQLAADSAAIAPTFWKFSVVANGNAVQFIVFLSVLIITLYATAKTFLKVR